jgi:AraC family transcriptional regulator of arabinose operon
MDRRVRAVVTLLDAQWRRNFTVPTLAREVGLGASRLEHLFKAHAKTTIRDFVRERRLMEAASRLASTEERISVISFGVGFGDVSNFNHAFKKRFGLSPRAYREATRNDSDSRFHQEKPDDTK